MEVPAALMPHIQQLIKLAQLRKSYKDIMEQAKAIKEADD